jgi:sugar phosphate isomerase/epimerase
MKTLCVALLLFITTYTFAQPVVGLQMGSVGKQAKADLPGTLKKLNEWGIRELEGGLPQGMEAADYLKMLKDNNLTLVAIGAGFEDLDKDPQKIADRAKSLGAKQVICYWIPHNGDDFTIDDAKKGVEVFNKAGEVLSKNGLALGYHAHGYEFRPYEGGTLFDYIAKNLDKRYANFQMDVFWIKQSGTDPVALLTKYPDRFISMHLKDRLKGMPDSNNGRADVEKANVVLGTGDVNIEAIVKAGHKAGIKHYFIEDESSRQWDQVPQSAAYLKTIKF